MNDNLNPARTSVPFLQTLQFANPPPPVLTSSNSVQALLPFTPQTPLTHLSLALPHIHVYELGPLDTEEVAAALGGYRLGEQRLTTAWRAIQQHARAAPQPSSKQVPARWLVRIC